MRKIYFKGYYGFKNLGDDIFTVTAAWICEKYWKNCKPIFIGKNLPQINNMARTIEVKNNLLRKITEIIVCISVKKIIYFGGSLFSTGGDNVRDIKFFFRRIPYFTNRIGTIGTSIGPFDNEQSYNSTKQLLHKFRFISVRDYSSIQELSNMGLENKSNFCFDNAILVNEVFPSLRIRSRKNEKLKIAISLCHYERYKGQNVKREQEREHAVKTLLENIITSGCNIEEFIFIEFNGNTKNGDSHITEEFNSYFKGQVKTRIIKYSSNTEEMLKELNGADFVVGMRLHSGILAYALNIPFMLVEYHPKCTEFLNTINHNYRFDVSNSKSNINNFNEILKYDSIPEMIKPEYFKSIMIKQLIDAEKLISGD